MGGTMQRLCSCDFTAPLRMEEEEEEEQRQRVLLFVWLDILEKFITKKFESVLVHSICCVQKPEEQT